MWPLQANELDMHIKLAMGKIEVIKATASELQALKDKLKQTFNGVNLSDWQNLAMLQFDHQDFITLQELPASKQGRGFFAINRRARKNWLLQAPHADSDLYTGKIVSRLFLAGKFKAAQWNTIKRNISDMAHTPDTYWQAFTQVFAQQYSGAKVIQLHGYDQEIRKTKAGKYSEMILSAGHQAPPLWVQQTAACLKLVFPNRVSLYPLDVQELGGTTNVQGQLLRSLGHDGFLHVEMSKNMREQLYHKADLRKLFIKCL